jgi:hypothetical protein
MPDTEGYCWWCGNWQELPFFDAVCGKCFESKRSDKHETRLAQSHYSAA